MAANKKWDSSHTFEQINILYNYDPNEWKIYINDFNPELEDVYKDAVKQLGLVPDVYHIHKGEYHFYPPKLRYCILESIYKSKAPKLDIPLIRSKLELLTTYESPNE